VPLLVLGQLPVAVASFAGAVIAVVGAVIGSAG